MPNAEVRFGEKVTGISQDGNQATVQTEQQTLTADYVVGADGGFAPPGDG